MAIPDATLEEIRTAVQSALDTPPPIGDATVIPYRDADDVARHDAACATGYTILMNVPAYTTPEDAYDHPRSAR